MEFKEQIKKVLIPSLKRMVEKEKEHYDFLQKNINLSFVKDYLDYSKNEIIILEQRMKEYENYCETH